MKNSQQNSARLVKALDYRHMADVSLKGRDKNMVRGYVLAIGGKWILMHETTPGGALDETVAIRRRYISHVAKTKHFSAQVLQAHKLLVPHSELGIQDLDSTRAVLRAMGQDGELISVLRDVARPDSMLVGSLVELKKKRVWLLEVTYRGRWKRKMRGIKPKHITRVGSGGDYLGQLALVAGALPPRSNTSGSAQPEAARTDAVPGSSAAAEPVVAESVVAESVQTAPTSAKRARPKPTPRKPAQAKRPQAKPAPRKPAQAKSDQAKPAPDDNGR